MPSVFYKPDYRGETSGLEQRLLDLYYTPDALSNEAIAALKLQYNGSEPLIDAYRVALADDSVTARERATLADLGAPSAFLDNFEGGRWAVNASDYINKRWDRVDYSTDERVSLIGNIVPKSAGVIGVDELMAAVNGEEPAIKKAALKALCEMHPEEAIPVLAQAVGDLDYADTVLGSELVAAIGKTGSITALPYLASMARNPSHFYQHQALEAIVMIASVGGNESAEATRYLADIADSLGNSEVYNAGVLAMHVTYEISQIRSVEALPVLMQIANGNHECSMRTAAAAAITEIGVMESLQVLKSMARDDSCGYFMRVDAIKDIGRLVSEHPDFSAQAVPVLVEVIEEDTHWCPPQHALGVLSKIAPEVALPIALRAASENPLENIRGNAIHHIADIGSAQNLPELMEIATGDPAASVRQSAIEAIAKLGSAEEILPFLLRVAAEDPDEVVRRVAKHYLAKTGSVKALPLLVQEATGNGSNRWNAIFDLAYLPYPEARTVLSQITLQDPDVRARERAIEALAVMGGIEVVPVLEQAALSDNQEGVRALAIERLHELDIPGADEACSRVRRHRVQNPQ